MSINSQFKAQHRIHFAPFPGRDFVHEAAIRHRAGTVGRAIQHLPTSPGLGHAFLPVDKCTGQERIFVHQATSVRSC